MAEATFGRGLSLNREAVVEWATPRAGLLIICSLMLVALVMRLWNLGDMALHHDESLHAQYSWYLFQGDGYEHNPLMHGPFLFHSGASVFFLFGDTDMTARLLPAIFGGVLVGMPFLLRRQIGMPAVIIAAVFLMFSPTLLYYSRFYRNEAYMAVWTVGMVICIWRYLDDGKERWLYGFAALLAFSFATKEVTFITAAIMLLFVDLMLAVELGKRRADETLTNSQVLARTAIYAPVAWLIASLWPLLKPQERFGMERLPRIGDVMIVLGTLALPQFSAAIQALPGIGDKGYNVDAEDTLRISTVTTLMIASLYVGLLWRPKTWALVALCFFVPYILLYTTFFTNIDGFFSGIWGSLDYWLDQHHEKRGNQPQYYYGLMTPLYEFLPLILAAAGGAWMALRGSSLSRWFAFWLVGIFIGLSVAGEKMPWLEVHIVLPLVFMAAVTLARALDLLELRGSAWLPAVATAVVTALATLLVLDSDGAVRIAGYVIAAGLGAWLLVSLFLPGGHKTPVDTEAFEAGAGMNPLSASGEGAGGGVAPNGLTGITAAMTSMELQVTMAALAGGAILLALLSLPGIVDQWLAAWVLALIPVALVGYFVAGMAARNLKFGRTLLSIGVAALLVLTVRSAITAAYENDDTPVEMLVYTQTSPDIPVLRDRIDALAERSGLGHNLPIVVDNAESFAWPWAWYLRDYRSVAFVNIDENYEPPPGAVLLISRGNSATIDASLYSQTPYKHRWWFCESYRSIDGGCQTEGGISWEDATNIVTDWSKLDSVIHYFFYRRDTTHTGSTDGIAFFPNDLAAFDFQPGPELPPHEPTLLADGRILIGNAVAQPGAGVRGELWQPADLFVDAQGSLWVADARNNRIQKFDAQGNFLDSVGVGGAALGSLNEPWGVAIDAEGFVYVADTWNHRIQKFSPNLEFVTSWGVPGTDATDPLNLFGPRDIAIAADGTLWVTDTGNQRVLHFSPDGQALEAGGDTAGIKGFTEPTSLAFDADGNLLVASTWTGDIRRIDALGQEVGTIDVGWTSQLVLDKPYLTVLADGRILVSSPESSEPLLFDANGTRVGAWTPLAQSKPVGVVAMPDGGIAFSDALRNEIQIVPAVLMDGFFQ